ncbi:hypothetical protein O0L34_g10689 [Tuta absoluta]|nr:hypothetical protein O0L34_g10689 [Tuta absoluta]
MSKCRKCRVAIGTTKEENLVRCKGTCEGVYHTKCAQTAKTFNFGALTCGKCQRNSPKVEAKLKVDAKKVTVEELLTKVNEKLEIMVGIKDALDEITEAVEFYAEQYQQLIMEKEKMEKKIMTIENKSTYLEKCNKALEERVVYLETKEKEKNIEIFGLYWKEEENIEDTVKVISKKLELDPSTIVSVQKKRVHAEKPGERRTARPGVVIVQLATRAARDQWIAKKKSRLCNNDVYNDGNSKPIYLNEDLPRTLKQLFWNAKTELKPAFKYFWVQEGRVLIRRDDPNDSKIRVIRTVDDLIKIKAAHT